MAHELRYNILTENDYLAGGQFFDWASSEVIDSYRIGLKGDDEFCIEDSIGRMIPFKVEDIDSLIDCLLTFRQDNEKILKVIQLRQELEEAENEL